MADLTLGTDLETQLPVVVGESARLQGLYVPGLTGTGKSTLLLNMICQDMEAGHGVAVFDPKGNLSRDVLERVPDHRVDDVIVLDPLDYHHPFGLNLFECPYPEDRLFASQTQERVMHVFEKVWYPEGDMLQSAPQLVEVLSNLTYLLISNPEYTMAEIPRILTDERYRAPLVNKIHNSYVKQWWITKYNRMGRSDQEDYVASTVRRIERFLQNPILLSIVGQNKTSVNLRRVMDEGKILLVRLPVVSLGEDTVTLLGSILISQVLIAALSRENLPEKDRRFFALYADEYHRFAISDFASLLAEARAFGLATTIAHQYLGQLDRNNQSAVKSTVNKVVFQVNPDDAHEFSKGFFHEPERGEITGYRPVQGVSLTPFNDLVARGHPDLAIREIVTTYLSPFQQRLDLDTVSSRKRPTRSEGDTNWRISSLERSMTLVASMNDYLLKMMNHLIDPGSTEEQTALESILFDTLKHSKDVYQGAFRELGRYLYLSPLMTATASMEPIYDRPRAYSDVQAEVASTLAHMRIRQAQIRVIQDLEVREYAIATNPPPPADNVKLKRQLISANSRANYTRPLDLVEAEIAKRQNRQEPGSLSRLE
jgi:hypothetical protein